MDKLDEQLVQVVVMQRQIPPLAGKMLDSLETFIKLDTPFRAEERRARIDLVRSSMSKPKVTASEQVRQVLEAYNIEAEYGRKIDTYEDKLADGTVVNILVIGRIGMFYQTKDERTSGRWNNQKDPETGEVAEHLIPRNKHITVYEDDVVNRADLLTDGPVVPHEILEILGTHALMEHLGFDVQEVYRLQGVELVRKTFG